MDNEQRADIAFAAIDRYTDCNYRADGAEGVQTDIVDLIADLLHLGERFGCTATDLFGRALRAYEGDLQDNRIVARRYIVREANDPDYHRKEVEHGRSP